MSRKNGRKKFSLPRIKLSVNDSFINSFRCVRWILKLQLYTYIHIYVYNSNKNTQYKAITNFNHRYLLRDFLLLIFSAISLSAYDVDTKELLRQSNLKNRSGVIGIGNKTC